MKFFYDKRTPPVLFGKFNWGITRLELFLDVMLKKGYNLNHCNIQMVRTWKSNQNGDPILTGEKIDEIAPILKFFLMPEGVSLKSLYWEKEVLEKMEFEGIEGDYFNPKFLIVRKISNPVDDWDEDYFFVEVVENLQTKTEKEDF